MSVVTAKAEPDPGQQTAGRARARFWDREAPLAYLFMIPGLLILLLFMGYPFFLGIYLSLTDKMVGFADFSFVGLENYQLLLDDPVFHRTVANTLIYSFVTVPFKLVLGLGLALVLNQTFRFSRFVRAGLLLPWIVPTAISSLAWLMLFDSVLSPVSWVLKDWGVIQSNINFLGDRWNAISAICVANVWRGLPFFAISILAGLQAVAPELHEAAALDGANAWQRFRRITLPLIRNIILITTLFSIIFTFSDFQLIYVLTKGGPASSTHVFGTYAYQTMGFSALGQAAAIALSMLPFLAIFAAILLREIRKED
ncbi:MAG: sugar ABC transporter permease [Thermomicrobiales bacterium]|nr:sugar ABC transporter permease [Thermomicrobiales bacterium]